MSGDEEDGTHHSSFIIIHSSIIQEAVHDVPHGCNLKSYLVTDVFLMCRGSDNINVLGSFAGMHKLI